MEMPSPAQRMGSLGLRPNEPICYLRLNWEILFRDLSNRGSEPSGRIAAAEARS
jgi:hypothetical protein